MQKLASKLMSKESCKKQADALYQKEEYAKAIPYYDKVLSMDPKDAEAWQYRGAAKYELKRFEEAIRDLDEAIRIHPKIDFPWERRGKAKRMLGRHEEAIQDQDEVIKLRPTSALAWLERAITKRLLKRYEEAIQDLNESIKLNPNSDYAKQQLRECKKQLDSDCEVAIRDCDEAIRLDPSSDFAWHERGRAKLKLRRYEEAIQDLNEAIKLNPKSVLAWGELGATKRQLRRYEEAVQDLNEAIKLNPKSDYAWYQRGVAKRGLGRYEEAMQDLNEAIKLNPNNDGAKDHLVGLKKKLDSTKSSPTPTLNQPKPEEKRDSLTLVTSSPVFNHTIKASMAISKDQLNFERRLGEGSFGEVHKGTWSPTSLFKVPVAIKQLKNTSMSAKLLEDFKREVEIQATLDSSGVVKLFGITAEQPYCMVMEFMESGSLRDILDAKKPEELHWDIRLQMAGNIAGGLAYLHGQNSVIIHGDLKSLNILVNSNGQAKLADFGLAALKTESRSKEYVSGNTEKNKGPKGSLLWIAPELFRMNAKRTPATDMFSLAVVFWEMASHLFPYESAAGNESLIKDWVTTGEREAFDERTPNTPKEYSDLVQRCWDAKPENRPSAENIASEFEALFSSTPLAPTLFSSSPRVSPGSSRKPGVGSGGYLANTATVANVSIGGARGREQEDRSPHGSGGYLVKSSIPSTQSPKPPTKPAPKRPATGSSGLLVKSATQSPTVPTLSPGKQVVGSGPVPSSSQETPSQGGYMGNVYK